MSLQGQLKDRVTVLRDLASDIQKVLVHLQAERPKMKAPKAKDQNYFEEKQQEQIDELAALGPECEQMSRKIIEGLRIEAGTTNRVNECSQQIQEFHNCLYHELTAPDGKGHAFLRAFYASGNRTDAGRSFVAQRAFITHCDDLFTSPPSDLPDYPPWLKDFAAEAAKLKKEFIAAIEADIKAEEQLTQLYKAQKELSSRFRLTISEHIETLTPFIGRTSARKLYDELIQKKSTTKETSDETSQDSTQSTDEMTPATSTPSNSPAKEKTDTKTK